MLFASRPGWNILTATLVLSLMLHGLFLLGMSLQRREQGQKMRIITRVDVVDEVQLPRTAAVKQRPRVKVPPPPLPDKVVQRAGHKGTRPGVGGDPAPAPKALKMDLPRSRAPEFNRDSAVLRDRSVDGDPERGNPFGDPNGVHGGTGEGGNGPGGTGGGGDGGFGAPPPESAEQILRQGTVECKGCHTPLTRPLNVELLANSTGWNIGMPGPPDVTPIEVQFEFQLDAQGKILKLRILKTSPDPQIQEALKYFAAMHEFTPPGEPTYAVCNYKFYPPRSIR